MPEPAGGAGGVAPPPGPGTVKVGVLLERRPAELGEWLADAAAFEAAGADALWVDPAPESKLDPLALLAALAVLTSRALLVATPPASDRPSEAFGRTLATVGRLSHGRLALAAEPERLEALTVLAPGSTPFRRLPGEPATFERLQEADPAERWIQTPPPEGRAAWRTALAEAVSSGAGGCWSRPAPDCWTSCATPRTRTTAATSGSRRGERRRHTGVLLAVSNQPVWSDTWALGGLFLASGLAGSAALLLLLVRRRADARASAGMLEVSERLYTLLELVLLVVFIFSLLPDGTLDDAFGFPWILLWLVAFAGMVPGLRGLVTARLAVTADGAVVAQPLLASVSAPGLVLIGVLALRAAVILSPQL